MDLFVVHLLNGLVFSMLLFVLSAGLSLIFGLMRMVNMTHGSFYMLGAYGGLAIATWTRSFWLAVLLAPLCASVVGIVMERLFIRPLYKRPAFDQVLLTFGFTFIFVDVVKWIWGTEMYSLAPPDQFKASLHVMGIVFPSYRLFIVAAGVLLAISMWLVLERSRIGAMVRASVDNRAMAEGLGIDVPVLFTSIFGLGVALAALAGVIAAPVIGIYPGMDIDILIPAFIVVVVGGMGSLRGALLASILIGEVDTLGKAFFPSLAMFLVYLLMVLVLLWRPRGLFGANMHEDSGAAGQAVQGEPSGPHAGMRYVAVLLIGLLVLVPFVVESYLSSLVAEILIFSILAMSLNLLVGYTGLFSFGHAAFFALGAYAVVLLNVIFGIDAWIGLVLAVLLAAAASAAIGYLCLRVSGISFFMLTLAFSQLLFSAALKWRAVTGGSDGIGGLVKPHVFGLDMGTPLGVYFLALLAFLGSYFGIARLMRSPLGHSFIGVRENDERMRAVGYAVSTHRLLAFTLGGALAGLSGAVYAFLNGFISPDAFHWTLSGEVLIMVILGGVGTRLGPVIGAAVYILLKNIVSTHTDHWVLIVGIVFVACVLFFRDGLYGSWLRLTRVRGSRP